MSQKKSESESNYLKVKTFNQVFGHPAPNSIKLDILTNEPKVVELRNALIKEEISELRDAYNNLDIIEVIDALSDILYVAYGLLVVYGLDGDQLYSDYMKKRYKNNVPDTFDLLSNFAKTRDYNKNTLILCSPKTFVSSLEDNSVKQLLDTLLNDLDKNMDNLLLYSSEANFDKVTEHTINIIYMTYYIGYILDIDLDESVRLVHESNMSKICDTEELAIDTIKWYLENEPRYDTPSYRRGYGGNGYVIYNKSTGKILKNKNYFKVDLSKFLQC